MGWSFKPESIFLSKLSNPRTTWPNQNSSGLGLPIQPHPRSQQSWAELRVKADVVSSKADVIGSFSEPPLFLQQYSSIPKLVSGSFGVLFEFRLNHWIRNWVSEILKELQLLFSGLLLVVLFYYVFLVSHRVWCGNLLCWSLYKAKSCSCLIRLWWIDLTSLLRHADILYNLNFLYGDVQSESSPGCWSPIHFYPLKTLIFYLFFLFSFTVLHQYQ